MINLYLDDLRPCPPHFVLALTAEQCKTILAEEEVNILSLDFDLGMDEPTGYEVVRYVVDSGRYPREIFLHTSSPAGRMEMFEKLKRHAPSHVIIHNGPMPQK